MANGKIKKMFPGGNTSQGFYSYYDNIIEPDAKRIFVIKGGPGVGKSTLMRAIGETMFDKGYSVEFHCCSSDNSSLDGVCIPEIGIAMLDGTAPHVVDPKNPGAVDEIVHLGDFWDENLLRKNKSAILKTNHLVGRFFQMAYFALKEAKVIRDEWESYITEAMSFAGVNAVTLKISKEIFSDVKPDFSRPAKARHLFASAITPDGSINYLDTILQDIRKLYIIKGEPGSGKAALIAKLTDQAAGLGLDSEQYHCSLIPQNIDVLVIPKLSAAVANLSEPVCFDPICLPNLEISEEINLSAFLNSETLSHYAEEIIGCKTRFHAAFNRAVKRINQAKAEHDLMESYYVPAMNFKHINAKKEELLARIIKYAEEKSIH
ncbi:PRK06851 family protein [Phosphitispora sp. TUW77]|uniref:PRK06851 family protein n=1 Tax=Phosphitispora sp. TUW77 TaxID=3152361 RepID=UPI003AB13851